jgi:hypothetical protein
VAELGKMLAEACLDEAGTATNRDIPLYVSLALYAGNLRNLLQQALPTGLDLADLLNVYKCTVMLDSANEMPRDYIEEGIWFKQFRELKTEFPACRFIVGSRAEPWIDVLDLPRYRIGDVD